MGFSMRESRKPIFNEIDLDAFLTAQLFSPIFKTIGFSNYEIFYVTVCGVLYIKRQSSSIVYVNIKYTKVP